MKNHVHVKCTVRHYGFCSLRFKRIKFLVEKCRKWEDISTKNRIFCSVRGQKIWCRTFTFFLWFWYYLWKSSTGYLFSRSFFKWTNFMIELMGASETLMKSKNDVPATNFNGKFVGKKFNNFFLNMLSFSKYLIKPINRQLHSHYPIELFLLWKTRLFSYSFVLFSKPNIQFYVIIS